MFSYIEIGEKSDTVICRVGHVLPGATIEQCDCRMATYLGCPNCDDRECFTPVTVGVSFDGPDGEPDVIYPFETCHGCGQPYPWAGPGPLGL